MPKIGLAFVVSVAGVGGRLAVRQLFDGGSDSLRPAESASDFSGRCVSVDGEWIEEVSCDDAHTGRVHAIVGPSGTCPSSTVDAVVLDADPTKRLCIAPG